MARRRVGTTPEAITDDLIALATDEVRRRLEDKTASSQLVALYAKEGTPEAILKRIKLEEEIKLLKAKTKAIQEQSDVKEITDNALKAFKEYSGNGVEDYESDDLY